MKTSIRAAPIPKPIPTPSETTFFFSSSAASSSSRRTMVLVRSATSLTAAPTPCGSVSWVGMAPPVDPLRERDAGDECDADDQERRWAAALLLGLLLALAELRAGR